MTIKQYLNPSNNNKYKYPIKSNPNAPDRSRTSASRRYQLIPFRQTNSFFHLYKTITLKRSLYVLPSTHRSNLQAHCHRRANNHTPPPLLKPPEIIATTTTCAPIPLQFPSHPHHRPSRNQLRRLRPPSQITYWPSPNPQGILSGKPHPKPKGVTSKKAHQTPSRVKILPLHTDKSPPQTTPRNQLHPLIPIHLP